MGHTEPWVRYYLAGSWRHMASLCLKWVKDLSCIVDIKLVGGLVLSVLWLSASMALDKVITNNSPSLNGKIEIHDSQCNLRCRAINIFKVFCRMNILGPNNILKMTSSQYSEMTLASWRLQPRATRLFVQQIIQINNKTNTKAQHHWVVSPHKWVGDAGIVIYIMTVTQHIMAQYGDINMSTLDSGDGLLLDGTIYIYYYLNQFWPIIGEVQWGDTSAIIY